MFKNTPLDNMLAIGAVTERSARIWVRVDRPGRYLLRWTSARFGGPVRHGLMRIDRSSPDLTGGMVITEGLEPEMRYRIALYRESGEQVATGSFYTAPDDGKDLPLRFSIALMSCHQPFNGRGRVARNTEPMLEAAWRAFRQHDVRQVVLAGDQLYADHPPRLSLFDRTHFRAVAPRGRETILDCTEEEVRALFHRRYRHFWAIPGWRKLLSHYPCYPILDDHEIVDNWGSANEHQEPHWQDFRNGAFRAYFDYQGTHVRDNEAALPDHMDYEIELGDTATYVMDLRSNRRVGDEPQVVSPAQIQSFRAFLEVQHDKRVLFVVLSVPLVHLPGGLTRLAAWITPDGEDFSDRWSSRGHQADRDEILRLLHHHQQAYPDQHIVLLSGDIHIGCLHQIRWRDAPATLYQFVSSGITHDTGRYVQALSAGIMRANRRVDTGALLAADLVLTRGERGARRNPCGRLNFGIVELTRRSAAEPPWMRFYLYSHRRGEPLCLFRSPPIDCGARSDPGSTPTSVMSQLYQVP